MCLKRNNKKEFFMKINTKEKSASGDLVETFTTNQKELELLFGIVNKASLTFPNSPDTGESYNRLKNIRKTLAKALKEWGSLPYKKKEEIINKNRKEKEGMNRYLLTFQSGLETGKDFTREIEALNAADAIAQGKLQEERCYPKPKLIKCEPIQEYEIKSYELGTIEELDIKKLQVSAIKQPHCCPVCLGRGFVAQGFYSGTGETFMSVGGTEPCRGCNGSGYVWN
jgi:hypothetical protein